MWYKRGVIMLSGKHIVLGVTGGIAAYKAAEIVSRLRKQGAEVRVVMSENAQKFIQPLTLETLCGNRAYIDQFSREFEIEHVALAKWADIFVVAPATANFIGKAAGGIADDLITTTAMAVTAKILIAPAMNNNMWFSKANQANMKTLISRGVYTIGPDKGFLACGDEDVGRMSAPEAIVSRIDELLSPANDLEGVRVLVTAGPTVERIDPVRYITNRSSGKMGYAIAEAARERGADVMLISGPTSLDVPAGIRFIGVESSHELCEAVIKEAKTADMVIQAAAPADFTPETVSDIKIKKKAGEGMKLRLVPTVDIAAELGKNKREGQILVAFAAETNDVYSNARKKLEKKKADMIVANDVTKAGAGFGVDTNIITLITAEGMTEYPMMTKREAADVILSGALEFRK